METRTELEPMHAEPQMEHDWLQKLVGTWTSETQYEDKQLKGTEIGRTLGGLWVVCEGQSQMPGGGEGNTILTLGYDPQKKRFIGTWIGSMMTHLWIYDGALDETEKELTLESVGPHMERSGETATYRDVIEFKTDDHRTLTGMMLRDDGEWSELMTVHYRRAK